MGRRLDERNTLELFIQAKIWYFCQHSRFRPSGEPYRKELFHQPRW